MDIIDIFLGRKSVILEEKYKLNIFNVEFL